MSTRANLTTRINRLIATIDDANRPRLISCAGARAALLAKLGTHDEPGQETAPLPGELEQFKLTLRLNVAATEHQYNVRFV